MAYVAISEALRNSVRSNISAKRDQELRTLKTPDPLSVTNSDPFLLEQAWGQYLHLKDQMPAKWCKEATEAYLRCNVEAPDGRVLRPTRHVLIKPAMLAPPTHSSYAWTIEVDPTHPGVAPQVEAELSTYAIRAKWDKVRDDVLAFLTNCKSLNEALKLWPDLRIYIPQHALDKVEEKTQKAKAAESKAMEILKQIDTDGAIANAVLVRMLEASKQEAA